ncbi:YveK family protein [Evansella clarkii]|uniref:YveK family protein n=1 Tax=Evansella clarkii TaxID=79879 RepID=UPI000B447B52|nr:Wzz/FepE/Etk N-terminal domain-containing protein [Evansella clarkii]
MEQQKGREIELKKILNALKKRFWIIILLTAVSTAAGVFYTSYTKPDPLYNASTRMVIHETSNLKNTLIVFITEKPVLEGVVNELRLERSPEQIYGQTTVQTIGESQIIEVTVTDRNQETAAHIANSIAEVFQTEAKNVFDYSGIDVLSEAVVAEYPSPINPPSNRMIYVALIFGLVAGTGYVLLLDSLDTKIRTERQAEKLLGLPVLGGVTKVSGRSLVKNRDKSKSTAVRGEFIGSKN